MSATRADPGAAVRAVLWCGVALGTAVVVTAFWDGARPRIPGMPAFLGIAAGAALIWLVVVGLAVWVAHLLRVHHRAIVAGAVRHGKRGAITAGRTARRGYGLLLYRLTRWAAPRWQDRRRAAPRTLSTAPAEDWDGVRELPASPAGASAPAANRKNGEHAMTTQAPPRVATGTAPSGWKALTTDTADFEPADDGELLAWMAGQVAGMLAYGEAIADVHEHCVTAVRLDPAAMAALHDVADAAADAAEAMARAAEKFKQVYEAPREFVADGGVLPKDGDFLTGDDA